MTHKANPASRVTGGGARSDDLAAERVPYCASESKKKGLSLFQQLVALANRTRTALKFEHAYGPDRPAGRGWWSPVEDGPQHYVRSARRRGRS